MMEVVLVWWRSPEVWSWVWEVVVVVWSLVKVMICVVQEMMVETWVVEGLDGGFVTGSPGFAESSRKTSQTVSNSFSISSAMCFGQPGKEKW